MLKTILTIGVLIFKQLLPLLITQPKFGKLFQLAYDAVVFVQATVDSDATDAQKREAALENLKKTAHSAGIEASDHILNKAIEFAVGKLKAV